MLTFLAGVAVGVVVAVAAYVLFIITAIKASSK